MKRGFPPVFGANPFRLKRKYANAEDQPVFKVIFGPCAHGL